MTQDKNEPLVAVVVYTIDDCGSREVAESIAELVNKHKYPSTAAAITLLTRAELVDYDQNDKTARIKIEYSPITYEAAADLQLVLDMLVTAVQNICKFTQNLSTFRK